MYAAQVPVRPRSSPAPASTPSATLAAQQAQQLTTVQPRPTPPMQSKQPSQLPAAASLQQHDSSAAEPLKLLDEQPASPADADAATADAYLVAADADAATVEADLPPASLHTSFDAAVSTPLPRQVSVMFDVPEDARLAPASVHQPAAAAVSTQLPRHASVMFDSPGTASATATLPAQPTQPVPEASADGVDADTGYDDVWARLSHQVSAWLLSDWST